MDLRDRVVVVTGGASGIGRALAMQFAAEGASGIAVADLNEEWAERVAKRIGELGVRAIAVRCDVAEPNAIDDLVRQATAQLGPIDVFCSNAGMSDPTQFDLSATPADIVRITNVNLLAHVWAAQAVVPSMVERGEGYLLQTISSAALITGPSGPGYTLTKHGALGFAEWLRLNYGPQGIRVSCLCPNAVYTSMLGRAIDDDGPPPADSPLGEIMMPEEVAALTTMLMQSAEPFLVLPHPRVGESFLRKAQDYDAWLEKTSARLTKMRAQGW